jgi:hypothetical protein
VRPRGRRAVTRAAVLLASGLSLAACTSPGATVVTGHPSISINVPLGISACTTSGSCVALGDSAASAGPSTTGEYLSASGRWRALPTPQLHSAALGAAACWRDGCLIGGTSSSSGDLLWRYESASRTLSAVTAPPLGVDVTALSCFAPRTCAVADSPGALLDSRLSFTADAGRTWSTPSDVPWSSGRAITSLACVDGLHCLAAAVEWVSTGGPAPPTVLEVTRDGGVTWSAVSLPARVQRLSSLSCTARHCEALATTATGVAWAQSRAGGVGWTLRHLTGTALAMGCTPQDRCVIAGVSHQRPWLAVTRGSTWSLVKVRYVPSSFVAAACGSSRCALVAPSTVASLTL